MGTKRWTQRLNEASQAELRELAVRKETPTLMGAPELLGLLERGLHKVWDLYDWEHFLPLNVSADIARRIQELLQEQGFSLMSLAASGKSLVDFDALHGRALALGYPDMAAGLQMGQPESERTRSIHQFPATALKFGKKDAFYIQTGFLRKLEAPTGVDYFWDGGRNQPIAQTSPWLFWKESRQTR